MEKAMLHEFLKDNRSELIARCRSKVSMRRAPHATTAELEHGVPLFLDQLTDMLAHADRDPLRSAPTPAIPATPAEQQIDADATKHGDELLRHDFTIDQVVHDYGDLCQSITELAVEQAAPITVHEFGILNIRLDNAIAGAVTEFSRQREVLRTNASASAMNERLGVLAHEMRNQLNTTILAITAIKGGSVGFGGATSAALDRSLIAMRALIDRTLADVRLEGGAAPLWEAIEIGPFIAEVRVAAALEASQKGCALTVLTVEPGMFVQADRHILASAVSNLLQNAFKFTRPNTHILLKAHSSNGRVLIDVEDECGGLPEEEEAALKDFRPFQQRGADRSGVGLGLSLSRKGIQSFGGILSVRNVPGRGCVFTIDLPRS
jgi:signal transduction histidine kinase